MSRSFRQRIERLEGDRGNQETPHRIVATCPIPESDLPLRFDTIERWLSAGLAHGAFRGHAVLYNGGRDHPLTIDEWQALHIWPRIAALKHRCESQRVTGVAQSSSRVVNLWRTWWKHPRSSRI
jgi:hypothetical protein